MSDNELSPGLERDADAPQQAGCDIEDAEILSETTDEVSPPQEAAAPQISQLTTLATRAAHHFSTLDACNQLHESLESLNLEEGHTRTRNGLMTGFAAGFEEGYKYANQLLVNHVATPPAPTQE